MKKTLLATLALLILASPLSGANYSDIIQSVRPLHDVSGNNGCTATSINAEKQYWLTAAHCVSRPVATFIGGHLANPVLIDTTVDLAILQTHMDSPVKALKIAMKAPAVGDVVAVIGHPVGLDDVQVFRGYVSSLSTNIGWPSRVMTFDMTGCGGNSGSSIVNSRGDVVSVMLGGYGRPCDGFSAGAQYQDLVRVVGRYFER